MKEKLPANIKCLILSVLLLSGFNTGLFSQKTINGVINKYAHVTGIGGDYVIVADETQFHQFQPTDTILLIQMKGVRIYSTETFTFGTPESSYGPAGKFEFLTILSVDDAINKITFRNNILNSTFNVESQVQIIKVPSFNSATVNTSSLSCAPWDSLTKTGGVLAAIVGKTLTLNENIDVSGKGFLGGAITSVLTAICGTTDPSVYDKYAYHRDYDNSGFKGEGPVIRGYLSSSNFPLIFPGYAKGRGSNFTGGGGGNGRFSGGGGGSNRGQGGKGGREESICLPIPQTEGGAGGKSISVVDFPNTFFMGGGGGSSTYESGATPNPGANGGGIIIIISDDVVGNGKSVLANGNDALTVSGNTGAGGGGGGGSIGLYVQDYTTSGITVSAKGGKGGNNSGSLAEGGGGGGGLIATSSATPANVTRIISGGALGTKVGGTTGSSGTSGLNQTNFVPVLNGFLFNSIRSSVTGTQIDSICSNVIPKPITGTTPVGGSGNYKYLWQKTYNLAVKPDSIPGSNTKDYTPTALESNTVWFRRVVKDRVTSLTDTSKWVQIIVQPAIENNLVGKDTTICYNQNPLPLIPLNSGPTKGNGHYTYQWIQNPNNTDWSAPLNASGTSTNPQYDPPALTASTFYKRVVTSGRCIDYSAVTTITVLPSITGNITNRPDSVICEGMLFNSLDATAAGGGNSSYVYQWQQSTDKVIWTPSPNTNTATSYTPDTATFAVTEQRYYRRVVWSGPDSVCRSNSLPIQMTRWHYIENNVVSMDATICSGSVPPVLTATTPTFGSGIYTYIWQDSSKSASWTTRSTSISPFAPPALTDTTWYRRIVNSSKCSNVSKKIIIRVHKPILNNIIALKSGSGSDTTICNGAVPNKLMGATPTGGTGIPGDYAFSWYYSNDNFVSSDIAVSTAGTSKDYQPGSLTSTTWFRRKTISGKCETYSNAIKVIVLPAITNNAISADQTVCKNTAPSTLTGPVPNGGDPAIIFYLWEQSTDGGTSWAVAPGASDQQNYNSPALAVPTKFRRTVKSGLNNCCIAVSNIINVGIHQLPTAQIVSIADTTICNGQAVKLRVSLTGATGWTLEYKENAATITPVTGITSSYFTISRIPDGLSSSQSVFNYTLASLKDNNNCYANFTDLTGSRKATIYRVPVADAGPATTDVCGPVYQLEAKPSDGSGTWSWKSSTPVLSPFPTLYNSKVIVDSSYTEPSKSYTFYWEEKNWTCVSKDSVKVTFYKRIDPINIGNDTVIHTSVKRLQLTGTSLKTGETGLWSVVEGSGVFIPENNPSTDIFDAGEGKNIYKWLVVNGKCKLEDEIIVNINPIVVPEGLSPNGDDKNDLLTIAGIDLRTNPDGSPAYQVADLTIINGAGVTVYTTSSRNREDWKDWDGKNSRGDNLPEGTYYYILKIEYFEPVKTETLKGFIILKRY